MTQSVFWRLAPFKRSCFSLKGWSWPLMITFPLKLSRFLFGFSHSNSPLIVRYLSMFWVLLLKCLSRSSAYNLFFRFFSPSRELVLMKHSPSFELASRAKSAGNVSSSETRTTSPTLRNLLSILMNFFSALSMISTC